MKKNIALFFFLFALACCSNDGQRPLSFLSGIGGVKFAHENQAQPSELKQKGSSSNSSNTCTNDKSRGKRAKKALPGREMTETESNIRHMDTTLTGRLNYLRSNRIEIDLNERVSRNFLLSPSGNQLNEPIITLGKESILYINFDNDILDYTDRFYTNGIKIDLIAPNLHRNPVGKLLIPNWGPGRNYYGVTVVQNMYTPSTTKTGGILYGDRPYAAYLYVGSFKITLDPAHTYRQTSEIDIGVIGPKSYGEWVQRSFHKTVPTNNEPLGWEYQIQNDLVLDYSLRMEKGIVNQRNIDLMVISSGENGTLYTNMSGGFQLRTGWMNPYFANIGLGKGSTLEEAGLRKFQFIFFLKSSAKLVGYDASLEGGLFNRSSAYTIPGRSVSRMVIQSSGGITLAYNGFRVDLEQFILSPEFHNGWWHKWVHLSLAVCL